MKHLLSSTSFIVLNKQLAKQVGLKEAILLADLISKEEYFSDNGMTDGWFFNTAKNIESDTCLTTHQQSKAINRLTDLGILETKVVGIPAKKHFKIIENKLLSYFNTSFKKSNKQVFKKPKTINKNKEIIITNNTISNRCESFILEVMAFDYDKKILEGFIDYWTEPNKSKTKMKFELNQTWSTNLRLKNWAANQKKWNIPKKETMSKIHQHLQKNINVKEKLLKQLKN